MMTRHEQQEYIEMQVAAKTKHSESKFTSFVYGLLVGVVLTGTIGLSFIGFFLMK
jgi:cell shape-determining protein MreD